MADSNVNRKLAAILSADVAGYSRLMQDDDAATVATLLEYRAAIARVIERHKGRVVNAPGDNILAEFPSAIEAVECADEIQKVLQGRNLELPAERRMEFRIGVNLGDVIEEEDGTIYGDGVNIAARMEALAEAGGICISSKVLDEVEGKLDFGFDFLGEQPVKNIDKPVRVYRVRSQAAGADALAQAGMTWRRPAAITGAAAVVLLAIGGVVVWLITQSPEPKTTAEAVGDVASESEVASVERMAFPLPEEPSIAVLPFDNLSGSAEHDLIADGLSENIIAVLSQTRGMLVIARSSTFTYKGKSVKVQQIAEELGVRYVLEGSVQISRQDLRVTAQLVDALTGSHIWSGRFDRVLSDMFAVQDEITLEVVTALQVELTEGAQAVAWRGGTDKFEAWNLFQRGLVLHRRFTKEDNLGARVLYEKSVAIDPNYALGWVYVGHTHQLAARNGWSNDPEADWRRAEEVGRKALALDPDFPDTYTLLAFYPALHGDAEQAIALARKGVKLGPGNSVVNAIASGLHLYSGRFDEALALMQRAMRLSPHSPAWYAGDLAQIQNNLGNHEEAIALAEQLIARLPQSTWGHPELLHALARLGRLDEAKRVLDDALERDPGFSIQADREELNRCCPLTAEMMEERESALRLAGVPEYPPRAGDDKPSIAVLPFENLSGDPDQEYLADGIAGDLITELSRLRWLQVTARNSTFTYRGRAVDVKQVGHDLGVRYVVEGSVQRADNRVRISARLIDAATGNNIWAERYERKLADIFVLQDEIADTVVAALQDEVGAFERERARRKPPESLDAWEFYQRGLWHLWRFSPNDVAEARRLFQHAAELDPNFAQTFAALGLALYLEVVFSYTTSPLENLDQAQQAANQAVALDDKEAMAHHTLGRVLALRGDYDSAIAEMRTAIDLNPSSALAHFGLGTTLMLTERLEEAISEFDKAIRLSPRDPAVWGFYALRAWARILLGDYESAVDDSRRAIRHPEAAFWPHAHLASALGHLGKHDEAKIALEKLLEINPDFTPDAAMAAHSPLNPETLRPVFKTWIDGLRKAGLNIPAEPTAAD
jgi:TolB-like protein/class 3 adenylate cyclase/Tfp pilus assembly protein PilF